MFHLHSAVNAAAVLWIPEIIHLDFAFHNVSRIDWAPVENTCQAPCHYQSP